MTGSDHARSDRPVEQAFDSGKCLDDRCSSVDIRARTDPSHSHHLYICSCPQPMGPLTGCRARDRDSLRTSAGVIICRVQCTNTSEYTITRASVRPCSTTVASHSHLLLQGAE